MRSFAHCHRAAQRCNCVPVHVTSLSSARVSRRDFVLCAARGAVGCAALGALWAQAAPEGDLPAKLVVDDPDGALARARAPVLATASLGAGLRRAAAEGRLELREQTGESAAWDWSVPAQFLESAAGDTVRLCWLMPQGAKGRRVFAPVETREPAKVLMQAAQPQPGGQFEVLQGASPVLRYNYAKVEPGDTFLQAVSQDNRKYALARSDYIHPLYGPQGECLTKDWLRDHPHHRGIYWAWPEVDWRGQRADLHALQGVFARPTGKCGVSGGPVFAQLDAENLWHWADREPIVRERAIIRAYAAGAAGRLLDFEFHFTALNEPVLLARRGAAHYGGLNLRFNAVQDQRITRHTDPPGTGPRMAWADLCGVFAGAPSPAGVAVIQHASNPHYPGEWVEYPELNWLQPTFPSSGARYALRKDEPLVLRFRLWIHPGGPPPETAGADHWLAANSKVSPLSSGYG